MGQRYFSVLAVALLGAVALVLSFVLTPTPDTFAHVNGDRVRVEADMHAVDYAILVLRIGGFVALVAGLYLTYRRWRPDQVQSGEDGPGHRHLSSVDVAPSRAGKSDYDP